MMPTSPPRTPPPRAANSKERRFKGSGIVPPCEWAEEYRPGGYHPVHLGDTFHNGQYKVIRKLGNGAFSTVWLARDLKQKRYVALKISISDVSASTTELQILRHIAKVAPTQGSRHITKLLADFKHHGPNGIHQCLVFEPMGPSVNSMVEELPQFNPRKWGMQVRYPPWMAKSILKQSLQALEFLHNRGIAHGDFQPGNMLFTLDDIDSKPEVALRQREDVASGSIWGPVERLDGKQDKWAPRYLCIGQPLSQFTNHGQGFKIKLSDMGGAYFHTTPPQKPLTPLGLRAPELILTNTVTPAGLDIWAWGCLVFELLTGEPLFCVPASEFQDDDHLLALDERLGRLPERLFQHWRSSPLYFRRDGMRFNSELGGVVDGGEPLVLELETMEEAFERARPPEMGEEEVGRVKRLLRRVLRYDAGKRPLAGEILRDAWFEEGAEYCA